MTFSKIVEKPVFVEKKLEFFEKKLRFFFKSGKRWKVENLLETHSSTKNWGFLKKNWKIFDLVKNGKIAVGI